MKKAFLRFKYNQVWKFSLKNQIGITTGTYMANANAKAYIGGAGAGAGNGAGAVA